MDYQQREELKEIGRQIEQESQSADEKYVGRLMIALSHFKRSQAQRENHPSFSQYLKYYAYSNEDNLKSYPHLHALFLEKHPPIESENMPKGSSIFAND